MSGSYAAACARASATLSAPAGDHEVAELIDQPAVARTHQGVIVYQ